MLFAASKEGGGVDGINLPEAFATVKKGRHSVCPNYGFWMYVFTALLIKRVPAYPNIIHAAVLATWFSNAYFVHTMLR